MKIPKRSLASGILLILLTGCGGSTDTASPDHLSGADAASRSSIQGSQEELLPVQPNGDDLVTFMTTTTIPSVPTTLSSPTTVPVSEPTTTVFSADALFGTDSAALTDEARGALREFVGGLPAGPLDILVLGFTDQRGSVAHNELLSQDRANSVAELLRTAAGERATVTPIGRGECCAIGTSSEAMARDRRVEITVTVIG